MATSEQNTSWCEGCPLYEHVDEFSQSALHSALKGNPSAKEAVLHFMNEDEFQAVQTCQGPEPVPVLGKIPVIRNASIVKVLGKCGADLGYIFDKSGNRVKKHNPKF